MLTKRVSQAFGKTVYLLGEDVNGEYVWLEEPTFDCGWYWGLGYIERYTITKSPERSRDITSHTHWDTQITGRTERGFIHHPNENPLFKETTLTDSESWELAELMRSAYTLRQAADLFTTGSSHVTKNVCELAQPEMVLLINNVLLPRVFKRIAEILTPANRDRR